MYMLLYTLGVYVPVYHPGYTCPSPGCTCCTAARYGRTRLTALTRGVTELTVSGILLTVITSFTVGLPSDHPFHCWLYPRVIPRGDIPVSVLIFPSRVDIPVSS